MTVEDLPKGKKAVIKSYHIEAMPVKLLQMGCLLGSEVKCLQVAPLGCPIYLDIEDTFVAIRRETACLIEVTTVDE